MAADQFAYADRIVEDPAIMVGKPVVRGTRIPVERVLAQLARTLDLDDLFAAYPELTVDDVRAVLAFAQAQVGRRRARRTERSLAAVSAKA
jgi:uncharacterized protein (DUF433 family)